MFYRRAGRRGVRGGLSAAGYVVSSTAAHLGGMLSFGLGIRVNRTMGQTAPESFVSTIGASDLQGEELRMVDVAGVSVLLARAQSGEVCALANTCTHLGGPLPEGSREGDTISCPRHGSRFDLRTGGVVQGPAVFAQPRLETRERGGKIEVGLPNAPGAELPELNTFGSAPQPR